MAAPLFGAGGKVVGALSVSGPSVRVSDQAMVNFGKIVRQTAQDITRALGGEWPA